MGEARPLNLLNITAWLISACSHPRPFCLHLGDHALAPCVLAPYVYMSRQRQETSKQVIEGKDAKSIWNKHKADKHNRHDKQRNNKANKQESKQKVVSARNKYRFGSNVHNFIVLKHGRHTSKQDSCINM